MGKTYKEQRTESGQGDDRAMKEKRLEEYKMMKETLDEFVDEWHGQPTALIHTDDGKTRVAIMGVGRTVDQLVLAKTLLESGQQVFEQVVESMGSEERELVGGIMDFIKGKEEKK